MLKGCFPLLPTGPIPRNVMCRWVATTSPQEKKGGEVGKELGQSSASPTPPPPPLLLPLLLLLLLWSAHCNIIADYIWAPHCSVDLLFLGARLTVFTALK